MRFRTVLPLTLALALGVPASATPQTGEPGEAGLIFGDALQDAGAILKTTYYAGEGDPYGPPQLLQHYALQLWIAGGMLTDAAALASSAMTPDNPLKDDLADEFLGLGSSLSLAGVAIALADYDGAASHVDAFAQAMEATKMSDDSLRKYGHGVVYHSTARLSHALECFGSGRTETVQAFQDAIDLGLSPAADVAALLAPFAEVRDRETLKLLGIDSELERQELLALPAALDSFAQAMEDSGLTAEQIFEAAASNAMSQYVYDIGEGLEGLGIAILECEEGEPTEDCPDLCTEDKDCAGCAASEIGLSRGNINPSDYAAMAGWVELLTAAGTLAQPTLPQPFGAVQTLLNIPGILNDVAKVDELFRAIRLHSLSLWVKMTYECCEAEECWDWYWFCPPLFTTVIRNVCKQYSTDWLRVPVGPVELLTAVQGRDARAFSFHVKKFEKQFCATACQGQ